MMNPARRSCLLFALPQIAVKPVGESPKVPDHAPPPKRPSVTDEPGVKASAPARAAVLVVVTMVAMVSLPSLIDRDDLVLGNRLSEWLISRASIFKVQALEEGMAEPVN